MAENQRPGQAKATMTDPRFRIRPLQQVASACSGAMMTACFSKYNENLFKTFPELILAPQ